MTALFYINQVGKPAGVLGLARNDISVGAITVTCPDSHTSYQWEIASEPLGTATVITDPTASSTDITLNETGSYIISLTVDASLSTEQTIERIVGIVLPNMNLPIPATWETNQDNSLSPYTGERGCADKLTAVFKWIDDNISGGGGGIFVPGTGTLSAQRIGVGLTTGGDYSFNTGYDNHIITGSDYSVTLGNANTLGSLSGASPYSLVHGYNNIVDDQSGIAWGHHVVLGQDNSVLGAEACVIGRSNSIGVNTLGTFIFGGAYDNPYIVIPSNSVGATGTVLGSCIIGAGNTVDCAAPFGFIPFTIAIGAFGLGNQIGTTRGVFGAYTMGISNIIDSSQMALVFGTENTVDDAYFSEVFGYRNTSSGTGTVIFGQYNDVADAFTIGEYNTVDGMYSSVLGTNNTISGTFSFVNGDSNTIYPGNDSIQIFGGADSSFGFSGNIVGTTNSGHHVVIFGSENEYDCPVATDNGFCLISGIMNSIGLSGTLGNGGIHIFGFVNSVIDSYLSNIFGVRNSLSLCQMSFVVGEDNTVSGSGNIVLGTDNIISDYTTEGNLIVGNECEAISSFSIVQGKMAVGRWAHSITHSSGQSEYGVNGDSQVIVDVPLRNMTSGDTWTQLYLDVDGGKLTTVSNGTYQLHIMILANSNSHTVQCKAWEFTALVQNEGGSLTLINAPQVVVGTTAVGPEIFWDTRIIANDTDDTIQIEVLGTAGDDINWQASVRCIELVRRPVG